MPILTPHSDLYKAFKKVYPQVAGDRSLVEMGTARVTESNQIHSA